MHPKPEVLNITLSIAAISAAAMLSLASVSLAASQESTNQAGNATPSTAVTQAAKDNALSLEQLQANIAALTSDKDLKDEVRTLAIDLYKSCLKSVTRAQSDEKQAAEYQDAIDNGPARARAIRQEALPPMAASAPEPSSLSAKELQQRLDAQVAAVRTLKGSLEELDRQIKALREDPAATAAALAAARAELDPLKQTALSAAGNDPAEVAAARRTLRQAQQLAAAARVHMLELMQSSTVARQDLLTARREQIVRRMAAVRDVLRQLSDLLNAKQRESASRAQSEAQRANHEHPAVRAVIEQNARFGKQLDTLIDQIKMTLAQLRTLNARLQEISQNYEITKEEMAIVGVGVEQAEALRRDRRKLPNAEQCRREAAEARHRTNQARVGQLQCSQEAQNLENVDQRCAQILAEQVPQTLLPEQREAIRARVRGLLNDRQQLIENLSGSYARYMDLLSSLQERGQQLASKSAAFAQLLDERLMWIPSASPVSQAWLGRIARSAGWLTNAENWRAVGAGLTAETLRQPTRTLPVLALIAVLLLVRHRLFARLDTLGKLARATDGGGFKVTGMALVITLLAALPGPALLWMISSLLSQSSSAVEFVKYVGAGLRRAAQYWLYLELLRQICRSHGLADAHFQWNKSTLKVLRKNLSWLLMVYVPLSFIIATTHASTMNANSTGDYASGLGRFAFVLMSIALSAFLWSVLHLRKGVLATMTPDRRARWVWRTRILWYPVAVITPLLLGAAALLGYYHAALALEGRLLRSFLIVIAVLLLHNLATRWLLLLQNKILLWEAREKHAAEAISRTRSEVAETAGQGSPQSLDVPQVDLVTINAQTRALFDALLWVVIGAFLWTIWVDMLPALRVLGNTTLWQHTVKSASAAQVENITVSHLVMAVLFAVLTVVATRNVPGLLEILLLPRLSLDAGVRYAINRIAIYIVITIGTIATFNEIGVGWDEVQWLAAAFSVGLGFGLQEIFANFVSGLIMLFERPIRVGDIVTVDGQSGTVSRIRMRATTITDWDNKEIIVPNKKFITDRVTNWTLTSPITRVVINVSLALGADTKLAERLMLEIACAHKLVLAKPVPTVFFTQFAESALNFELRVFVKEPADRMPVLNDLHMALNEIFQKHGIRIP